MDNRRNMYSPPTKKQLLFKSPIRVAHPRRPSASPIRDAHPRRPSATPIRDAHPRRPSATPIRDAHPRSGVNGRKAK